MPITKFRLANAGPFDDLTFEFDERVNIFVGPNNSGKSTALLALAEVTVYPFTFPRKFVKDSGSEWEITFSDDHQKKQFSGVLPIDLSQQSQAKGVVGLLSSIGYTTFIPSLRRSTDYRSKGPSILSEEQLRLNDLENANNDDGISQIKGPLAAHFRNALMRGGEAEPELRKRRRLMPTDAALVSDEWVIQKMVDLDYAAYRRKQPQIHELLKTVAKVASEITEGYPVEFLRVSEDERGLFPEFQTIDGDLPVNVLSQGTQSTIQWLAHFLFGYAQYYEYPESLADKPGILIVDEIDVHLHPTWQRRIIPALISNFPNLQIFCSTHSPLMLSGLREGQVQLLQRDADLKVTASRNESDIVGWSADEILRHVLDLRNTTDLETSSMVDRVNELYGKMHLNKAESEELDALRGKLNHNLLGGGGPSGAQIAYLTELLRQVRENSGDALKTTNAPRPTVRRRQEESK